MSVHLDIDCLQNSLFPDSGYVRIFRVSAIFFAQFDRMTILHFKELL